MKNNGKKYFENAKIFLLNMELGEAHRSLHFARKKGDQPHKMHSYLLLVDLLQANYRNLHKEFSRKPQLSSIGYYTKYWFQFLKGDISGLNNTLAIMLKGDNYFARTFALTELWRRGKIHDIDTKIREYVKYFNLSYDMNIEEQRASVYLDILNRRHNLAVLQIKSLIKEYPAFTELYIDLMQVLSMVNERVVAMDFLLDPKVVEVLESDLRLVYLMSREFYRYERFDKAKYYLKYLTSEIKGNPIFHFNMANVYSATHHYHKAIREYQECLSISPDFERAHFNLGTIYLNEGYYSEAFRHLNEAHRLKPQCDTLYNLSVCLVKNRNLEEAYRHLQNPDNFSDIYKKEAIYIRDHIREAIITA